jgi:hypothetical protein
MSEKKRLALVVFDVERFHVDSIMSLAELMENKGYEGIFLPCMDPSADLQLFDLDALKPADAAEIRELLKKVEVARVA